MANYPTVIDTFINPTPTEPMNNPSHSAIEDAQNTALSNIETNVGVNGSGVTTTIDYLLKNTSSVDPGHKHTPTTSLVTTGTPSTLTFLRGDNNWASPSNFGGTGADGVFNITSGTTTVNLSNAAVYIKNYTSMNISGSALLNFSNPNSGGTIVIFRVSGNVTLTSSNNPNIDVSNLGTAGGTAGSTPAGAGGAGGGAILIECAGAINITGNINAGGQNGSAGTGSNTSGGGGGGGGMVWIIYNILGSNTGTINVAGGAGGTYVGNIENGTDGVGGDSLNSLGIIGTIAGAHGGGEPSITTQSTVLNLSSANAILSTRVIPLLPGTGGGGAGNSGAGYYIASGDGGNSISGTGGTGGTGPAAGGAGANGFSAVVQNAFF